LRAYLREAIAAQKAFNECEEFAAMMEETK
jgi:hypothetical protein